jgi:SAM-dependent methyltransferase
MNPLQAGFWMPGDSLAPPCGTSVSVIHQILLIAKLTSDDVLYDFGCGDGRVCLEAWYKYQCRSIGIELEQDLVDRARALIGACEKQRTPTTTSSSSLPLVTTTMPEVHCMDLRQALNHLVYQSAKGHGVEPKTTAPFNAELFLPNPTVIILYLLPEALEEIKSLLSSLLTYLPNCRVVCNSWGIPSWRPMEEAVAHTSTTVTTKVFVYTKQSIPAT